MGSNGRFMPDSERLTAEASRARTAMEAARDGFEKWYWRVCNESAATMVNVELGVLYEQRQGVMACRLLTAVCRGLARVCRRVHRARKQVGASRRGIRTL